MPVDPASARRRFGGPGAASVHPRCARWAREVTTRRSENDETPRGLCVGQQVVRGSQQSPAERLTRPAGHGLEIAERVLSPGRKKSVTSDVAGSITMDHAEPGLFELPDLEPQAPPPRPQRGRNRETWARTAAR